MILFGLNLFIYILYLIIIKEKAIMLEILTLTLKIIVLIQKLIYGQLHGQLNFPATIPNRLLFK